MKSFHHKQGKPGHLKVISGNSIAAGDTLTHQNIILVSISAAKLRRAFTSMTMRPSLIGQLTHFLDPNLIFFPSKSDPQRLNIHFSDSK